jgi:predicted metal-binding membrane protein
VAWASAGDQPLPRGAALLWSLLGLAVLAWAALWAWGASPYARYLDHSSGALAALCESAPLGAAAHIVLYVVGWTLMVVAMMLPTTLPLLQAFSRLVAKRRDRGRLLAWLCVGYVAVWLAYGAAAHALDRALHELVAVLDARGASSRAVGAGLLLLAGAFQFSPLKHRCLEQCRSTIGFIAQRWRGAHASGQALRLGVAHGAFCVGCCWALMMLMFVVGTGSVGWMLVLAGVMAAEKNLPGGHRLSAPLGTALLVAGAALAADALG